MADRIVLMLDGRVEQVGAPSALYFEPANAFVAEFFGDVEPPARHCRGRPRRDPAWHDPGERLRR